MSGPGRRSTRIIDDYDTAQHNDFSVRNINNYIMDINQAENVNSCYYSGGARNSVAELSKPVTSNGVLDIERKVELETYVQNRHVKLGGYNKNNEDYKSIELQDANQCGGNLTEHLVLDESRLTHPLTNYREMRVEHYNFSPYLPVSPQEVFIKNNEPKKNLWSSVEERMGSASRLNKSTVYRTVTDWTENVDDLKPK
jgi:hypothetical protein